MTPATPDELTAQALMTAVSHPSLNSTTRHTMIRAFLRSCSDDMAKTWRRMVEAEKKRRQRETEGNALAAAQAVPIQRAHRDNVPVHQGNGAGQCPDVPPQQRNGAGQIPSPGSMVSPTPPSLTPTLPETPYNPPPTDKPEPDAEPAAPGESDEEQAKRAAKEQRRALATRQVEQVGSIMHRTLGAKWSDKEKRAFRKHFPFVDDEIAAVSAYYANNWPPDRDLNILRHDLATLLNNWSGEVDRAKRAATKRPGVSGAGPPGARFAPAKAASELRATTF